MKHVCAGLLCLLLAVLLAVEIACGQAPSAPAPAPPPRAKKFELSRALEELREKLPFEVRGRRDPFESPLLVRPAKGLSESEQKKLLVDAEQILKKIRAMKARGDYNDAVRETVALRDELKQKQPGFTVTACHEQADGILRELQMLLVEMEAEWRKYVRVEAQGALAELRTDFDKGHYRAVVDGVELFREGVREVAKVSAEVQAMLDEAVKLAQRAKTYLEFENIDIVISGLIWVPGGALAIINGKDVRDVPPENEMTIDTASGELTLQVKSIGREEVVFLYKGELIARALYE